MTHRERVIGVWRARLVYWRERLDSRRPWVAKAYVRVLSFLLSRYASGEELSSDSAVSADKNAPGEEPDGGHSRMTYYQAPTVGAGKPARSGDAIRGVLDTVRQSQPPREPAGPLAGGLPSEAWIGLASLRDKKQVERLRRLLAEAGMATRVERRGRLRSVLVQAVDKDRAKPIVVRHAVDCSYVPRRKTQYAIVSAQIGAWCGLFLGWVLFGAWLLNTDVAVPGPHGVPMIILVGGMMGLLCGAALGFLFGKILDG